MYIYGQSRSVLVDNTDHFFVHFVVSNTEPSEDKSTWNEKHSGQVCKRDQNLGKLTFSGLQYFHFALLFVRCVGLDHPITGYKLTEFYQTKLKMYINVS